MMIVFLGRRLCAKCLIQGRVVSRPKIWKPISSPPAAVRFEIQRDCIITVAYHLRLFLVSRPCRNRALPPPPPHRRSLTSRYHWRRGFDTAAGTRNTHNPHGRASSSFRIIPVAVFDYVYFSCCIHFYLAFGVHTYATHSVPLKRSTSTSQVSKILLLIVQVVVVPFRFDVFFRDRVYSTDTDGFFSSPDT